MNIGESANMTGRSNKFRFQASAHSSCRQSCSWPHSHRPHGNTRHLASSLEPTVTSLVTDGSEMNLGIFESEKLEEVIDSESSKEAPRKKRWRFEQEQEITLTESGSRPNINP
ncbi:hypothetical protein SISNIDRAFT_313756 [Sistotremastrum niveocremeum HHB9708]|uniref:Uncharacterized protein n=2 Tax=Sistotremastraceae TaxID=3402574 RepID=A0A164XY18_9AGAM|nr:hypothetical protein SISNIDRAFT_313756 [Sistotremastrum niveocremeum HHB9708]KZT40734.1 hypothetical protein SISSUDRAFT_440562 [Sistotremastrum suecicum HHB10207 ss-3]